MLRGVHWPERTATFVVRARSGAPPERVFALLADAPAWVEWAGPSVSHARWEDHTAGGAGAVRELGIGRLSVREQVVVHQPSSAFSYLLLTGNRWHAYRADVVLTQQADGTGVTWTGRITSPVPGVTRLLLPCFRLLVTDFARRLVRAAES